jgi:hypothetical protein
MMYPTDNAQRHGARRTTDRAVTVVAARKAPREAQRSARAQSVDKEFIKRMQALMVAYEFGAAAAKRQQ